MSDSNVFRGKAFMTGRRNSDFNMLNHFSYFILSVGFGVVIFIVTLTLCCHCAERLIALVCCKPDEEPQVETRRHKRMMLLEPDDEENSISRELDRDIHVMRGGFLTEHTICHPYVYRDRMTTGLNERLYGFDEIIELGPDFLTREPRSRLEEPLSHSKDDSLPPSYDEVVKQATKFIKVQIECEEPPPPSYKDCMRSNNSRTNVGLKSFS